MTDVYLASQSPRRRELLAQLGVRFEVLRVDVPEQRQVGESPEDYVLRLAHSKSRAGAALAPEPVLGADTIVVLGADVLEKPQDEDHAVSMLTRLGGRTHTVMTAVALTQGNHNELCSCHTLVKFRSISEDEARAYWLTGEPRDKAGGYGIQGFGAVFVQEIQGSYSNVVGLPLFETAQLLNKFKVPVWNGQADPTGNWTMHE